MKVLEYRNGRITVVELTNTEQQAELVFNSLLDRGYNIFQAVASLRPVYPDIQDPAFWQYLSA